VSKKEMDAIIEAARGEGLFLVFAQIRGRNNVMDFDVTSNDKIDRICMWWTGAEWQGSVYLKGLKRGAFAPRLDSFLRRCKKIMGADDVRH
jgi:hypothetical protein